MTEPIQERTPSPSGAPGGRAPEAVPLGSTLGKYRVASVLGRGSLGIVYEAEDSLLHRRVALRQLPDALAGDPPALNRFLAETRSAVELSHANVVHVYGVEERAGTRLLVTEFVGGGSAADQLAKLGRLPWRDATRIVAQACRGLAAAHEAGLVHGDIKPANLLIAHDGTVKLADLGLASFVDIGTADYLSPEQCRGESPDVPSDLYALGATYFTLLTGHPPFGSAGASAIQVKEAHCHQPVPNVRAGLPNIPLRCDATIRRAMAKDPAERYPTAAAMLADLEAVLAADDRPAPPPPPPSLLKPRRPPLWKRLAAWAGGLATLALALAFGYLILVPRANVGASAKADRQPPTYLETVTNSVGLVLARVPPGTFLMGDPYIPDARSVHFVRVTRPFLIGAHEVTRGQYRLVIGEDDPFATRGDRLPVEQITWEEAKAFCEKLSARAAEKAAGRVYRLPTEAEWEYCCRAGTRSPFAFGPQLASTQANFRESGLGRPAPVGTYPPNAWGLYDMHGNVGEWCADWYGVEYYAVSPAIDPTGPRTGTKRVVRGGGYLSPAEECRSGRRIDSFPPDSRPLGVGLRVVCTETTGRK